MITSDEAAEIFIDRVIIDFYQVLGNILETDLPDGLPGRVDDPIELEKWYQDLDNSEKNIIKEVVHASVKAAMFSVLVILDNMTGGFPIKDRVSDFALYLQTYTDSNAKLENQSIESVRLNSLKDYELHDLFIDSLNETDHS